MTRKALALTLALATLLSVVAGVHLITSAKANPFYPGENTPPPEGTQPPKIVLFFPKNNTTTNSNNISLTFDVSASEDTDYLTAIYYQADWLKDDTSVYHLDRTARADLTEKAAEVRYLGTF